MLQQIDVNNKDELKELATEMNLTTTERLKFQLILKKVPKEKQCLDVCYNYYTFNHMTYTNLYLIIL